LAQPPPGQQVVAVKPVGSKMTVNAVSLMSATLATNAFGLVFWAVAARLDGPRAVGSAFAEVAALILLSTLAQLNLSQVFIRFLPGAGRLTRPFIVRGYLVVTALALVVGSAFVLSGLGTSVVRASLPDRVLFVVSVALFAIFALQDSVLIGLRIAHWVPVENISFAAAKLALLPLLVFLGARTGIVVAWVLPIAAAVAIVNTLLFRGAVGRTRRLIGGYLPVRRRLASFVAAEYSADLCITATVQLMPLLVLWRLGAVDEAYFTLPWLIRMGILVLFWNVNSSFVVEVLTPGAYTPHVLRRGLQLWGAIVAGAVLVCCLGAPLLLGLEGSEYAEHSATLLRLIGLSVPFTAVTVLYGVFAWLERRLWRLVAIQAATGLLMAALSLLLMPRLGVTAVGWANLAAQAIAAALMAPSLYARLVGRSSKTVPVVAEGLR